jgi:hypothetical protein
MSETNPFVFELSEVIEYSKGGDFFKTAQLEFTGPNMAVYDLVNELSGYVFKAIMDMRQFVDKEEKEEEEEENPQKTTPTNEAPPQMIKAIFLMSKTVKFSNVAAVCKRIFLKTGTYDGETKIKENLFSKISIDDYNRLIFEYCSAFIVPSLLSEGD